MNVVPWHWERDEVVDEATWRVVVAVSEDQADPARQPDHCFAVREGPSFLDQADGLPGRPEALEGARALVPGEDRLDRVANGAGVLDAHDCISSDK